LASITRRGDRQWQVKVRRRQWTASATFETKARAEMWARQVEGAIDARRFNPGSIEADRVSFHAALERYLRERVPLKTGVKQNTGIVRAWQRTKLSAFPLSTIRGSDIAEWRDQKLKEVGPQTVVHHLNLLSNLFNVAASDWGMESLLNPVSRVSKPVLPSGRSRRLSDREEAKLLDACDASKSTWLGPMVRLALETAMRQGELVDLSFDDVDLAKRVVLLRETKNGTARTVPLSPGALEVLRSLANRSAAKGKLFDIKVGRAVTHAFAKACEAAGIEDLRFHDLRHEATSRLFERTDLRDIEIAGVTGHKTMEMLKRYAHLRAVNLVERLGRSRAEHVLHGKR
jgi:integrase